MSGIPLLVINGQQDSRFLIHNPVLGAPTAALDSGKVPSRPYL
jgi:benzoylformate decarboxylase